MLSNAKILSNRFFSMTNNTNLDITPKSNLKLIKQLLITFIISICIYTGLLLLFIREGVYQDGFSSIFYTFNNYGNWYTLLILPACFSVLYLFRKSASTIDGDLPLKEKNFKIVKKVCLAIAKVNFILFLISSIYLILLLGVYGIWCESNLNSTTMQYGCFAWRFDILAVTWLWTVFSLVNTVFLLFKKGYTLVALSGALFFINQNYFFNFLSSRRNSTLNPVFLHTSLTIFLLIFMVLQSWDYIKSKLSKSKSQS